VFFIVQVVINPEIIPANSNEGLNANKTSSDLLNFLFIILSFIAIVVTLKFLFKAILIFLGLRFIWDLASG
tara:strand:- start:3930 stop:4142 length:213 start_codon:yes stop_codon:yes gene_type:complete